MHGREGACRAGSPSGRYIVLLTLACAPAARTHEVWDSRGERWVCGAVGVRLREKGGAAGCGLKVVPRSVGAQRVLVKAHRGVPPPRRASIASVRSSRSGRSRVQGPQPAVAPVIASLHYSVDRRRPDNHGCDASFHPSPSAPVHVPPRLRPPALPAPSHFVVAEYVPGPFQPSIPA